MYKTRARHIRKETSDSSMQHLNNKHKRRTSLPVPVFEPAIPAIKWLKTYALDRTATGIGSSLFNDGFLKHFLGVLEVIMTGVQWNLG